MRRINVIILSLCLIVWVRPGMTQFYAGWPLDTLPKDVQLQADGAAFFGFTVSTRNIYVGEAVPVEIEVGVRQGLVVSLNGLPILEGSNFTLNNLSKQPQSRIEFIDGSYFQLLTWHTAVAAVKPGDFSLSAEMPISALIGARFAAPGAATPRIVPKQIVIKSATLKVRALPLPTEGQPQDFNGAVGDFQISSDISPISVKEGEPLTLRLHVRGKGNFERVESTMVGQLDHWKTYPAKASFAPSDTVGDKGEKVFEQPLIAVQAGEQSIPGLKFNYFSPSKRRYEHTETRPIKVMVAASLFGGSSPVQTAAQQPFGAPAAGALAGLRPDHLRSGAAAGELRPLYFQGSFLLLPAALALLLTGGWYAARPNPARASAKATARVLRRLDVAARAGDVPSFFEVAKSTLLQTLAVRWQIPAEQITGSELRMRLGSAGEEVERLFAGADEAKYSGGRPGDTDLQHWLTVIRGQLGGSRR